MTVWSSAFATGAQVLTVRELSSGKVLYSGSLAMNGSVLFVDIDNVTNMQLAVDGAGNVSLSVQTPSGWGAGTDYEVDVAAATGVQAVQIAAVTAPVQVNPTWYAAADGGGRGPQFSPETGYLYPVLPVTSYGMVSSA